MAEEAGSGEGTAAESAAPAAPAVAATAGGNPPATQDTPAKPDKTLEGPPMGVLNRRSPAAIRRHLDPSTTTIWSQISAVTEEVFKESSDVASGPYRAICLTNPANYPVEGAGGFATPGSEEKPGYDPSGTGFLKWIFTAEESGLSVKKLIQIRARIPELHMHLPIPSSAVDFSAISMYPVFTAETEDTNNGKAPASGELVYVDFGDRQNKTDGIFISSLRKTQDRTAKAGVNECAPASSPASMGSPAQGGATPVDVGTQGPVKDRLKAQPGQKAVIIGDSQCQGALGRHISKYIQDEMGYELIVPSSALGNARFKAGGGRTFARHSSKIKHWMTEGASSNDEDSYKKYTKGLFHMIKPMLEQGPSLIVFVGGGNGIATGQVTQCIAKMRTVQNAAIAWFSLPLAVKNRANTPLGGDTRFDGAANNWTPKASYNAKRQSYHDMIKKEVGQASNAVFVSTPALMPRYQSAGCGGCDGVHAPNKAAEELITNLKAAGSPTPGGESLDFINATKNLMAGLASGAQKAIRDFVAVLARMESKFGEMTKEDATGIIKQGAERLGISEDEIKSRDWMSGYKKVDGSDPPSTWSPPTYFEVAKMFGFQSPNKEALGENLQDMSNHLNALLSSEDATAKAWAENYYQKEYDKALQLYNDMGNVNMSLPGEPFPKDIDTIKALQMEQSLRFDASTKKLKEVAAGGSGASSPAESSAGSAASAPNCGYSGGGSGSGGGSTGPLPTVNIGNIQFKEGDLTPEEAIATFMAFGKKYGYDKYHMCILAACVKNESGPINKNRKRTGAKCTCRLEPHVSARNMGEKCPWRCCHGSKCDGTLGPKGGWMCKGDPGGKFSGATWSGVNRALAVARGRGIPEEKVWRSLTPGIAQSFWCGSFLKIEGRPLGNSAAEYVAILRKSHAAQIFTLFAFVDQKDRLKRAIFSYNMAATARYYNGQKSGGGKLGGYAAKLEMYCRGLSASETHKYYNWSGRKIKDSQKDWFTTNPPTHAAAMADAAAMKTDSPYSLNRELFKGTSTTASDIIMAQYDSYTPET